MNEILIWLDNRLPKSLTTRITFAMIIIVIAAGLISTFVINQVLARTLQNELTQSGVTITRAVGENLANPLLEGDLATVQEALNSVLINNSDVIYAFAFGPGTPIIHTFPDGFPSDLINKLPDVEKNDEQSRLIHTHHGFIRDFGYHPINGVKLEIHLGISQNRIATERSRVTTFILGLTFLGCLIAALITYVFSRFATRPLVELTRKVRRLGEGSLDERIYVPKGGEVGDLAVAFNQMAIEIQQAISRLQKSELGYRDLIQAASAVGEGIALISDEKPDEGAFMFVNETFASLTGYIPEELLGTNAASVLHPDSINAVRTDWESIKNNPNLYISSEITILDKNGISHYIETSGTLINYQGQRALAWFARDISERKLREEELRHRNRELTAVNAIASAVSASLHPDQVLERALDQSLIALDLKIGWVYELKENNQARMAASRGILDLPEDFQFPNCRCGSALITHGPIIVKHSDANCTIRFAEENNGHSPLFHHITVPLQAQGKILGVLSLAASKSRNFSQDEVNLLIAIGQQIGIALDNARLWEQLKLKEQLRGELLARAIRAQEEERERISRELHDATGQSLNALVVGLNTTVAALGKSPEIALGLIEKLRKSASETVKELQGIIYDLRPSLLDDLGLVPALRWYAGEKLKDQGVIVSVQNLGVAQRLPSEVETALFRIGQEAITNISKHANAKTVNIVVKFDDKCAKIEVVDDGYGFQHDEKRIPGDDNKRGIGLLGMQERASLLGGHITINSQLGKGTVLEVVIPLEGFTS